MPRNHEGNDQGKRKEFSINLDAATPLVVPPLAELLRPVGFETTDGRSGWVLGIPGNRPIATPAYADGLLFVGGGYGSHEFYAFDARSGDVAWKIHTNDDGPTAAVVEDGFVAFNTESCTVMVCEATTGRTVWEEWLGDPLMSQPAISQGRLFMVYPKRGDGRNDHWLLCADLKTGRHIWEQPISGDVMTAPIISKERVYLTCLDGWSYCLDVSDGRVIWKNNDQGTSSPTVGKDFILYTKKRSADGQTYEGVFRKDGSSGRDMDQTPLAEMEADYLRPGRGGGVGISGGKLKDLDSSVGFSMPPLSGKFIFSDAHVGVSTVAGAWAYQGSKAAFSKGRIMNAQGRTISSMHLDEEGRSWRSHTTGGRSGAKDQVFCPPALGKEYMYLCSTEGHLVSLRQTDGEVGFLYDTKQPMAFQPSLAAGNLYAGTGGGLLLCLRTGSDDADGCSMWGGNAQHNKSE